MEIIETRSILGTSAEKLIRKYPTIYGKDFDESTIASIKDGSTVVELVIFEDGTRGLRSIIGATPTKKVKKEKIAEAPAAVEMAIESATVIDSAEPVGAHVAEDL